MTQAKNFTAIRVRATVTDAYVAARIRVAAAGVPLESDASVTLPHG